jgi:hypothetical protein
MLVVSFLIDRYTLYTGKIEELRTVAFTIFIQHMQVPGRMTLVTTMLRIIYLTEDDIS